VVAGLLSLTSLPLEDFVEYWAAGRLNARGENPYDPERLYRQELEASPELTEEIMMWNPPWTLTVAMPFGLLPAEAGRSLWLLLHVGVVLGCADWLWRYYGGPTRFRWTAWIIGLAFAPTFFVLRMGQIGPLVLLGLVGFLYFEKRGWFGWAGAAAALAAFKPHLVYLFAIALLLWARRQGRWTVLVGGGLTLAGLTVLPLARNPAVLEQYRHALSTYPPRFLAPIPGSLLRLAFGIEHLWLNYVPTVFGLGWLAVHWRRRRRNWVWAEETAVLLLVSFLTASYGVWQFDLVVLLIPVLQAALWVCHSARPRVIGFALTAFLGFEAMALLLMNVRYTDQYWHVWMTPMLLYSYVALRRQMTCELPACPVSAGL
jgi:hypothetical protein